MEIVDDKDEKQQKKDETTPSLPASEGQQGDVAHHVQRFCAKEGSETTMALLLAIAFARAAGMMEAAEERQRFPFL